MCVIDDRAHKGRSESISKWCVSVHTNTIHVTTPSVFGWFAQSPSPIALNSYTFLCRCLIDNRAHKGRSQSIFEWCMSVHSNTIQVTTPSVFGWFAQSPSPIVLSSRAFFYRCFIDDRGGVNQFLNSALCTMTIIVATTF